MTTKPPMQNDDDDDELDYETIELQDLHQILVGNTLGFAKDLLNDHDSEIIIRVMRIDGHNCIDTRDYNINRVNVAVESRGDSVSINDTVIKSIIGIG